MDQNIHPHPEIMCTVTAAQIFERPELVEAMYVAGMRSVRINTAHLADVDSLGRMADAIKSMHPDIRILIDTKGPELRTTGIADTDTIILKPGQKITLMGTSDDSPSRPDLIYVNYPNIHTAVQPGDRLLIDDGHIELTVDAVNGREIAATVAIGGVLGHRKGLTVAGKDVDLPAVSERDREFISYAAHRENIDVIAHSFVRSAADVLAVKAAMGERPLVGMHHGASADTAPASTKPVIAKIENQRGIDNLPEILRVADGILIARGDLSAAIGADRIPQAQSHIAAVTKAVGKPLYLATAILPSMMQSSQPSDSDLERIDTALRQGTDVMLLTNETATGLHPVATVATLMHRIQAN